MASIIPSRAARTVSCSTCRSFAAPTSIASAAIPRRGLSTSTPYANANEQTSANNAEQPRWSYTPPRAKAPFSLRLNSKRPEFPVNSNPKLLDEFYIRMLGTEGDKLLSEEVKWLAVTHKSFDQGRRGFNDRLAFLGKRIVQLQASLALVQDTTNSAGAFTQDAFGRKAFTHPALDGLNNLSANTKNFLTGKTPLAELARKYELQKVLRWAPRKPNNLEASGIDLVLAHTMYAVVGAISLEKGGHIANKIAQERILAPLGVKTIA
ncbi:hypothetical protein ASPWEDRAFT_125901 [Aspergillus wentii DTO 134E9]|uniref:RNase III domain-containing protein n=1 Tax=Aspergillus wentii DTO 134E9 TaxID=1073089 RepID=A0A1L9S3M0_ASPWE|nr:uncharacterized protein ASPWEDRAFT_125901 [Aspergillus wentii DTO 134E9]KAI9930090.1 hypothetical protein MW887_011900 [Aspergillus wentii]OJJ41754.1 hypothetical protein ASPWEDRAFT_125901 [Aspergillus wentii DTO 134E9]